MEGRAPDRTTGPDNPDQAGVNAGTAHGERSVVGPHQSTPLTGKNVLLGVTGGVAAYKAAFVARDLSNLGAGVDVVMTSAACNFVGPTTFEALTGRVVRKDMFETEAALDHIRLARAADVVCVAPATADLLARAAAGRADDLLSAVLLATEAPVLLCPAMNDRMYNHPQTQRNLRHLSQVLGYHLVGPAVGPLAIGEGEGPGRMVEPSVIVEHIGRALQQAPPFSGKHIVVTVGPTREALDPIRFISNRSSGRMGFAIAAAAWRRGARVTLIAGATSQPPPPGPDLRRVETAAEMEEAVRDSLADAHALIMAAAPADFRPATVAGAKIKRDRAPQTLALEPVPDILAGTISARPEGLLTVGFALETKDGMANARRKLEEKQLDLIVLNDATEPGAGFEVETNRVTFIPRDGAAEATSLLSKPAIAELLLDRLAALLDGRG